MRKRDWLGVGAAVLVGSVVGIALVAKDAAVYVLRGDDDHHRLTSIHVDLTRVP